MHSLAVTYRRQNAAFRCSRSRLRTSGEQVPVSGRWSHSSTRSQSRSPPTRTDHPSLHQHRIPVRGGQTRATHRIHPKVAFINSKAGSTPPHPRLARRRAPTQQPSYAAGTLPHLIAPTRSLGAPLHACHPPDAELCVLCAWRLLTLCTVRETGGSQPPSAGA